MTVRETLESQMSETQQRIGQLALAHICMHGSKRDTLGKLLTELVADHQKLQSRLASL